MRGNLECVGGHARDAESPRQPQTMMKGRPNNDERIGNHILTHDDSGQMLRVMGHSDRWQDGHMRNFNLGKSYL